MRKYRFLHVLAIAVCLAAPAFAQEEKTSHAGYVKADLSKAVGDKEPSVQVMLDRPLLKLVASASKEKDEDLNALISQLAFVRVNVYEELSSEPAKLAETVDAQVAALAGKGWSTVAKIREDGQRVDVLMKSSGENIVGFVVFVSGDGELVFVNVAGDIEPEKFGAKLGTVVTKLSGGELDLENMAGVLSSLKTTKLGTEETPKSADDETPAKAE